MSSAVVQREGESQRCFVQGGYVLGAKSIVIDRVVLVDSIGDPVFILFAHQVNLNDQVADGGGAVLAWSGSVSAGLALLPLLLLGLLV